jgi:hypothetical protein
MRNVFTKHFLMFGCFVLGLAGLQAQSLNTLTINNPSGIAGEYQILRATWGSQANTAVTADLVFAVDAVAPANDGCTALTNNASGKIVLVDRGVCAFDVKAKVAQDAGAIAVIICNNVAAPEPLFLMAAGNVSAQVNIPTFVASKETCDKIRVDVIAGGVNGGISNTCKKPDYGSNAVWGNKPGEGDFSNGFTGWTVDKGWEYNADGIVRRGAYIGSGRYIGSATACNGMAEFNSDHLDNKSVAGAFGTGDCPAPCTGYLLSPEIVFEKPLDGLTIEFSQNLRMFQSQHYIMVSTDNGETFRDTVRINAQYPVNSNHIAERVRVAFTGYAGVTKLRFKFENIGNYYYWGIDDIVLYNENYVDLQVNRDWYSVAPTYKTPASQVSEIPFMADVANLGNADAKNVNLKMSVTGPGGNKDYTINYGDIPAASLVENRPFPQLYTPPAVPGKYTAEYFISGNGEADGLNNRAGFDFFVTDKTFASLDTEKDFGSAYMQFYAAPWLNIPDSKYYTISNIYYVPKGNGYTVTNVRFGLANANFADVEGRAIRLDLFEWVDLDGDDNAQPNERQRVGTNFVFIDETITDLRNIEVPLWASDEDGFPDEGNRVKLKDKTTYLMAASSSPNSDNDPRMDLLGFTPRALDNYNRSIGAHRATNFALDTVINLGLIQGPRASGSLHGWENTAGPSIEDIDNRLLRLIFNGALYTKAYIEMDVALASSTEENQLTNVEVKTFPNPATRDLFVDVTLEKVSSTVTVNMFDMEGKLALSRSFSNVQDDRLRIDLSNVANGAYTVSITTTEGQATRKVVVQK